MTTVRRFAVCVVAVACAFGGCAAMPTYQEMPIAAAKSITQASEDIVIAMIMAEADADPERRPLGSLLSCRGDRNYRWAGGTDIVRTGGAEMSEIADATAAAADLLRGWRASREASAFDAPRVVIRADDSASFVVTLDAKENVIRVDSFSPCFHLRDDESPHGYY